MRTARIGPAAAAAGGVGAAAYVAVAGEHAWTPGCAFHAMTGLWCPGCGLTRAARATLDGDLPAAIGHNALAPLFVVAIVVGWSHWWLVAGGREGVGMMRSAPRWAPIVAGVALVLFAVARNVPVAPFAALAP